MIKQIKYKKNIFAYIFKITNKNGVNFFTPKKITQQVGILNHKKGHKINPHIHFKNPRKIAYTTEVLIILKGKVRVDFFNKQKKYLFSKILKENDIIMLVHGAHGFKVVKKVQMLEIKQGPYINKLDKIKFNEIDESKIKIKK